MTEAVPTSDIVAALCEMGLIGPNEDYAIQAMSGGVSCDVVAVHMPDRSLCVKRALPKLRVAADWHAPAERAEAEVAWIRLVAGIEPRWVPRVIAEDRSRHLFIMEFLPPETYPVWKALLATGKADADFAGQVGTVLARIHAHTARNADIAAAFANDAQFHALRIEPYLLHTAAAHPDVGDAIRAMASGIAASRIALMHGDFSPKNILAGPEGPVILDAETACYGDPAFDAAFCLNHLLLKSVWHPEFAALYGASFTAFQSAYLRAADWEDRTDLERRAAWLLPALLLARIDGKSPVEYLTSERDHAFVRARAKAFFKHPPADLNGLAALWFDAVETLR
jgi:aminoglycoside phosphotransferase (APT) family kinase protein